MLHNPAKLSPQHWTTKEVLDWVRGLPFDRPEAIDGICAAFRDNDINGKVLLNLTSDELRTELGIASFGLRKIIMSEAESLRTTKNTLGPLGGGVTHHLPRTPKLIQALLESGLRFSPHLQYMDAVATQTGEAFARERGLIIYGPRRCGKTSTLVATLRRVALAESEQDALIFIVDFKAIFGTSQFKTVAEVVDSYLARLRQCITMQLSLSPDIITNQIQLFKNEVLATGAISDTLCRLHRVPIEAARHFGFSQLLVAYDEFEYSTAIVHHELRPDPVEASFNSALRLQLLQGNCHFIITGTNSAAVGLALRADRRWSVQDIEGRAATICLHEIPLPKELNCPFLDQVGPFLGYHVQLQNISLDTLRARVRSGMEEDIAVCAQIALTLQWPSVACLPWSELQQRLNLEQHQIVSEMLHLSAGVTVEGGGLLAGQPGSFALGLFTKTVIGTIAFLCPLLQKAYEDAGRFAISRMSDGEEKDLFILRHLDFLKDD